jgi:type III pantothenate kinase
VNMNGLPFLLLDAGSTRLKWATASAGGAIRLRGTLLIRAATKPAIRKLAAGFPEHRAVLACVVPKLVPLFRRAFGKQLYVVTGASRDLPLSFAYPRPGELGADRIAAAVAAQGRKTGAAIIVSCGTAVAFTVLDEKGRLCGGAIAPGLQAQLDALLGATAQLPAVKLAGPIRLPGKSTRDAIRAGVLLNFRGGVKEIVARLAGALPGKSRPRLLLTGGDAVFLRGALGPRVELRPLLVMEGLRIIGTRVFAPTP